MPRPCPAYLPAAAPPPNTQQSPHAACRRTERLTHVHQGVILEWNCKRRPGISLQRNSDGWAVHAVGQRHVTPSAWSIVWCGCLFAPDMSLVCRKKVKDGPFLLSLYQGSFYVRLKFTGKLLLVKNRSGPHYQENFYVRSKFRCKSVSQLCLGIFMGNFYTTCIRRVEMV